MSAIRLCPMTAADLPEVASLDALCQPHPWGERLLAEELERGEDGFARLLRDEERNLVGYFCGWRILDELHVGLVGVDPRHRRQGLGLLLLQAAHDWARGFQATLATLEVRAGNTAALALYARLGYRRVGLRRGYYPDNGEDAVLLLADL